MRILSSEKENIFLSRKIYLYIWPLYLQSFLRYFKCQLRVKSSQNSFQFPLCCYKFNTEQTWKLLQEFSAVCEIIAKLMTIYKWRMFYSLSINFALIFIKFNFISDAAVLWSNAKFAIKVLLLFMLHINLDYPKALKCFIVFYV